MTGDMPRPRPRLLQRETTRHGKTVWYVRVGKGPRIRIDGEYGSAGFQAAYDAAIEGRPILPAKAKAGSLKWLIERYKESAAWEALSPATRRQRLNIFAGVIAASGGEAFSEITKDTINAGKNRRERTPAQARNFLDAMRGLFRWALLNNHVKRDPTEGVTNPKRKAGQGFKPWTEADVSAYEARWPLGTKERVWLDVLLYSGLRRGDAVRYGRQHVRDGIGALKTEKTGELVTLPILPVLQRTLDAGPTGDLTFICGERGHPLTKESFGNYFSEAARKAGVMKSAHGVRKIAATRAAENGATVAELEALFGWRGGNMASLYTRAADRSRLAKAAIGLMVRNKDETSIPAPGFPVRGAEQKA